VFYLRAIAAMAANGLLAVEMEAAALYAFASARSRRCARFAHITNRWRGLSTVSADLRATHV